MCVCVTGFNGMFSIISDDVSHTRLRGKIPVVAFCFIFCQKDHFIDSQCLLESCHFFCVSMCVAAHKAVYQ